MSNLQTPERVLQCASKDQCTCSGLPLQRSHLCCSCNGYIHGIQCAYASMPDDCFICFDCARTKALPNCAKVLVSSIVTTPSSRPSAGFVASLSHTPSSPTKSFATTIEFLDNKNDKLMRREWTSSTFFHGHLCLEVDKCPDQYNDMLDTFLLTNNDKKGYLFRFDPSVYPVSSESINVLHHPGSSTQRLQTAPVRSLCNLSTNTPSITTRQSLC